MTPMPIFIPISNGTSGGGTGLQNLIAVSLALLIGLLILQYAGWCFLLMEDEFKNKKRALLGLIPFYIIFVFVRFVFDKLRDLD